MKHNNPPAERPDAVLCARCAKLIGKATGKGGAWIGPNRATGAPAYWMCMDCMGTLTGVGTLDEFIASGGNLQEKA